MERIGRYRIIGELGRGAMGVVYHAIDPSIGRPVAIKTVRIHEIHATQQREKLRTRLFREARSAGVLSHPNIVTIYDMDEDNGLAYIAMAFVNGPTLEKILSAGRPLSGAVMLRLLRQTATALDYAHSKGIVHRDVKPANIMTDEDGAVKITDFGIAKLTTPGRQTETQTILGTPNYMSPEQVQGVGIDGRSDQFSLAVLAYEMLTGERPFIGEAIGTVVYKIVAEEPAPVQRLNGTLTAEIDGVLRRALAKKAELRFNTCVDFIAALEKACKGAKGWKTVAANTAGILSTAGHRVSEQVVTEDAPVITPGLPKVQGAVIGQRKSSIFVPLILSLFVVSALGAVIAWQLGWQPPLDEIVSYFESKPEPPPKVPQIQPPAVEETVKRSPLPTDDPVPAPAENAATSSEQEKPVAENPVAPPVVTTPAGPLQDLWITSNPPGAKAVVDDRFTQSCLTPCTLKAAAGKHRVTIAMADFVSESREVMVGNTAVDVPPVTLKQVFGSVMVTSHPAGAGLRVDGKAITQRTPVTLSLPPGDHVLSVERNGQVIQKKFEVRAGSLNPWSVEFQP